MPAEGKDIGGAECLAERSKIIGHLVDQSYPLQLRLITSAVLWSKHVFQPCALSHTCNVILVLHFFWQRRGMAMVICFLTLSPPLQNLNSPSRSSPLENLPVARHGP